MPSAPKRYRPAGGGGKVLPVPGKPLSAAARGYDHRWRRARESFLADYPLCERCGAKGLVVEATVVDHRVPHRGDPVRFWDRAGNWAALCKPCHDRKTMTEDRAYKTPPAV